MHRLVLLFAVLGCTSSSSTAMDAGYDGGGRFDGGPDFDGEPPFDGGPARDTGLGPCGADDSRCGAEALALLPIPSDILTHLLNETGGTEVEALRPTRFGVIDEFFVDALVQSSSMFASAVADRADECVDDTCRRNLLVQTVERLWRRPLTPDEALALEAALRTVGAETIVLQAVLVPDFLYETLVGEGPSLSREERLQRFAMRIWRVPASGAELAEINASEAPIARLLDDPRSARGLHRLHDEIIFRAERPESDLAPRMLDERHAFVEDIFASAEPTFVRLFSANHSFVDDELAAYYGMDERPGPELARVAIAPGRGGGLLTQGAFTTLGSPLGTRGAFIAQQILCRFLPEPPAGTAPPMPGTGTERERWETLVTDEPSCAGCHQLFDHYSFGLLGYGNDGRYTTEDMDGVPIDASFAGDCIGRGGPARGEGASDLVEWIAASEEAHRCFARHWNGYLSGAA